MLKNINRRKLEVIRKFDTIVGNKDIKYVEDSNSLIYSEVGITTRRFDISRVKILKVQKWTKHTTV